MFSSNLLLGVARYLSRYLLALVLAAPLPAALLTCSLPVVTSAHLPTGSGSQIVPVVRMLDVGVGELCLDWPLRYYNYLIRYPGCCLLTLLLALLAAILLATVLHA